MTTKAKRDAGDQPAEAAAAVRGYADLHDHLKTLDKAGLLVTVKREINNDTEMHPLVRWQFRDGIAQRDRNSFLFTHVTHDKCRRHHIPSPAGRVPPNRP